MDLIPALLLLLPLVTAAAILLVGRKAQDVAAYVSVASCTLTFVMAIVLLGRGDQHVTLLNWIDLGDTLKVDIGLLVDRLSRGMMFVVTAIGTAVHWYSLGYMKEDASKWRYFGGLSIFMFSMTGIVLADNFIMMFIFWELVGVSSYLLIGHWFQKDSAADAAKKAFLSNRIGDFGFMLGILVLWGLTGSIAFEEVRGWVAANSGLSTGLLTAAALLVFCGAVGKSAQLPLHVWLPDAMEGPTPVSALIHAATMVAAGVYMLFRVDWLIAAAPTAGELIAWVGGLTSLFAALVATQQNDIKRILAYSTLSQLGYMVMAVGLAHGEAGMFHLFTHAFFKALLFLGAGAVIYACHHEQDIWKMGGLKDRMPKTFWTFVIGTAALIAVPFTSGFSSKEMILAAAWQENKALFLIAVIVATLTAFYMMRLVVVTFLGSPRTEHAEHAKEVPLLMWVPLVVLAVPSVLAYASFTKWCSPVETDTHFSAFLTAVSLAAVIIGAGLGFVRYLDKKAEPKVVPILRDKFYFDELYTKIVAYGQDGLAYLVRGFDSLLLDSFAVGGISRLAAGVGGLFRRLQVGNLQGYALLFGGGVALLIYLAVFVLK